jgi:hypothetical protein
MRVPRRNHPKPNPHLRLRLDLLLLLLLLVMVVVLLLWLWVELDLGLHGLRWLLYDLLWRWWLHSARGWLWSGRSRVLMRRHHLRVPCLHYPRFRARPYCLLLLLLMLLPHPWQRLPRER